MNTQPTRASYNEHREHQRPIVEKLRELTRKAKELRSKGQTAQAESLEREAEKFKGELGITSRTKKTLDQKKAELKARIKRA